MNERETLLVVTCVIPQHTNTLYKGSNTMGFEQGRPLKNLIYGLTHPLKMAREKPILFLLVVGGGVLGLGLWQGWWSLDSIKGILPFVD